MLSVRIQFPKSRHYHHRRRHPPTTPRLHCRIPLSVKKVKNQEFKEIWTDITDAHIFH